MLKSFTKEYDVCVALLFSVDLLFLLFFVFIFNYIITY